MKFPFWIITACLLGVIGTHSYLLDMQSHIVYGLVSFWVAVLWFLNFCKKSRFHMEDYALIAYLISFSISLFLSEHPFGFQEFVEFFMGALIYWTAAHLNLSAFPKEKFLKIILSIGTLFSLIGIIFFLSHPNTRLAGPFQGDFVYSDFPNAMALLLLILLPLQILLWQNSSWGRLALLIQWTAFWLTFSRGASLVLMGTLVLGILLMILSRVPLRKFLKPGAWTIGIMSLSILTAFALNSLNPYAYDVSDRLGTEDVSSLQSLNERYLFWEGAVKITKDHPWFGFGPGGFEFAYPKHQDEWLVLSSHPHNIFLKIASESGIPAAFFFLIFFITVGIKGLIRFFKEKELQKKCVQAALLLSIASGLAHNLIDYNLNFTLIAGIFFGILGLLNHQETSQKRRLPKAWIILIALGVSLIVLLQGYGHAYMKNGQYALIGKRYEDAAADFAEAKWAPFPGNLPELELLLALETGQDENIKEHLDILLEKYPNFFPYHYYQVIYLYKMGLDTTEETNELLNLNGKNSLVYLLFIAKNPTNTPEETKANAELFLPILEHFTELLSINMHQTLVTNNPEAAQELFQFFISQLDPQSSLYIAYQSSYEEFGKVWRLEISKFNDRFGSELKPWSLNHDFEVLFTGFQ